jgi:hypothetical protein
MPRKSRASRSANGSTVWSSRARKEISLKGMEAGRFHLKNLGTIGAASTPMKRGLAMKAAPIETTGLSIVRNIDVTSMGGVKTATACPIIMIVRAGADRTMTRVKPCAKSGR